MVLPSATVSGNLTKDAGTPDPTCGGSRVEPGRIALKPMNGKNGIPASVADEAEAKGQVPERVCE